MKLLRKIAAGIKRGSQTKLAVRPLWPVDFTLLVTDGSPFSLSDAFPVKILRQNGLRDLYGARFALIRPDQHVV